MFSLPDNCFVCEVSIPYFYCMKIAYSKHALERMDRRGITKEQVNMVLDHPDSVFKQDNSITIFSKIVIEESKHYLYRVFVNIGNEPMLIVTAYKTSKLERYGY